MLTVYLCDIYNYGEFQQKPVFTAFQGREKIWRKVRMAAKLPEVRIHDLRHSIASVGLASGDALPIIGKLLSHSDVKTTARYAHLADDTVKAAANRISGTIAAAMAGAHGKPLSFATIPLYLSAAISINAPLSDPITKLSSRGYLKGRPTKEGGQSRFCPQAIELVLAA